MSTRREFLAGLSAVLASLAFRPVLAHTESNRAQHSVYGRHDVRPTDFVPEYVQGAIAPFTRTSVYQGAPLSLPMIDLAFSKEGAIPPHLWGLLYDDWRPAMEEEGLSVFLQDLRHRGPDNARKRIYMSALTPDLYVDHYRPKVRRFLEDLFAPEYAAAPLMRHYYEVYWDLYWDLHLGVRGDDIPEEVRQIGDSFNAVIGFWDPRQDVVYENYMRVRELRPRLREWIDERLQDVIDGRVERPEATFAHYWVVNGDLGPNFRRKDVVFECFHNFLAFSQWGNTLYRIMHALEPATGDPTVQEAVRRTMSGDPDARAEGRLTPLDRLVHELFRTISPNDGSLSNIASLQEGVTGTNFIIHPHPETSRAPRHWEDPDAFDPERYRDAPLASDVDEEHCARIGLSRCPFTGATMRVEDGRDFELPSSGFGTVFAKVDGTPVPLVDDAGFAPFGFGYRRCAGEWLTIDFVKDVLRYAWAEHLSFRRIEVEEPERLPVGPVVVIEDDIGFVRPS